MRAAHLLVAGLVFSLAGCSRNPEPEVVPVPPPPPPPTTTTPPPPPPPPPAGPTCAEIVTMMVNELATRVHFDTDRSDIRPGDAAILSRKVPILRDHPEVTVRATGHADERHTDEYNLVLGTRRAEAVKDHLVRNGIAAGRIQTASLGETQPLDPGHTEEAWARNRRVEITVITGRETLSSHEARCR